MKPAATAAGFCICDRGTGIDWAQSELCNHLKERSLSLTGSGEEPN